MLKIIKWSHLDHGLTQDHVEWLLKRFKDKNAFFVETIELPEELSPIDCALYGPDMGDEPVAEDKVTYAIRGTRKCASRIIQAPKRKTRKVTVVAGVYAEDPCVLFTAYGGPAAPREPGDTTLGTWEDLLEARAFWKVHALAAEPTSVWIRTDKDVDTFIGRVKDALPEYEDEGDGRAYAEERGAYQALKLVEHELKHAIRETAPGRR